ncbi:MAG: hypothetical protein U0V74_12375 [Chitinophagales bacterium]
MSNLKKSDDFLKDGVISEEAMIAYLNNTLSSDEKQQFEKLLAEDPFAQDALEGLQAAQNKAAVTASIANVRNKVRERSGARERKLVKLHWTNYAWAAAVFGLLIGIGFLMVNYVGKNNTTGIAQNKTAEQSETSKPIFEEKAAETQIQPQGGVTTTDSTIVNMAPGTYTVTVQDANGSTSYPLQQKMESKKEGDNANTKSLAANKQTAFAPDTTRYMYNSGRTMNSTITANGTGGAAPAAANTYNWTTDKSVAQDDAPKADEVVVTGSKMEKDAGLKKNFKAKVPVANEEQSKMREANTETLAERKEGESTIDDAMKSFNSGDYKKSSDQFDAVLKQQPENPDALYFGGISDYINGKSNKSEKNFDKLLKDGKRYIDGSKWYKANILLKKGKTEEAKKLLQELANTNGSYKERALKKMEEVK